MACQGVFPMEIVQELITRIERLSADAADLRRRLSIYQEHYFNAKAPAKQPKRKRATAVRGA
jgi:hypothetical protein